MQVSGRHSTTFKNSKRPDIELSEATISLSSGRNKNHKLKLTNTDLSSVKTSELTTEQNSLSREFLLL